MSFITVSAAWCLFVHQPGAYHAPGASDTQVIHSDHTLSTFLRIRADSSMLIFWVSVTVALSNTLLMFSTIPFFIVPSAPTTRGITCVFICHILFISNSRFIIIIIFKLFLPSFLWNFFVIVVNKVLIRDYYFSHFSSIIEFVFSLLFDWKKL